MWKNILQRLLHKIAFSVPGGSSLRPWLHRQRGVKMGQNVWISQQVYIDELYPSAVTIGDNSTIGFRTSIFTHLHWGAKRSMESDAGPVIIEKDVFIGPHCVILPNVRIGEGAVVKAGTVVTRNVPPFTFWGTDAAGPLARITVPLSRNHEYEAFVDGLRPIRKRNVQKGQPKDG
jgi:acetyltransferase-like isoleucine patch superfamily enzyme